MSHADSNRFIVPVPAERRHGPDHSGGGGGHWGHGHGSLPPLFDSYWGGCYYWGGSYYFWSGDYYSTDYDRFGRYRSHFPLEQENAPAHRETVFFFPPTAPPLGAALPPKSPELGRIAPPPGLASYPNDPFYAPLGTRMLARDLSKKRLERLSGYHDKKTILGDELRAQIARTSEMAPEDRLTEAEKFARKQQPSIRSLETEAEALRTDLLHNGLVSAFWGSGDWNDGRPWRLGDGELASGRDETLAYEFKVMRAAVFYQDGLSPAQRRLLREIAIELQVEAFRPLTLKSATAESLLFFQPETARLRLPTNLPAELEAKIAVFKQEKDDLKAELRETLYRSDALKASSRAAALRQLASCQAPRFDELEELAEDIRKTLALHPELLAVSRPPAFPPELAARIATYQKAKLNLQRALQAKIEETREILGPEKVTVAPRLRSEGPQIVMRETADAGPSDEKREAVRDAVLSFNRDYTEKFARQTQELSEIRREVDAWLSHNALRESKTVDGLLKEFEQSSKQEEIWPQYQDYRDAVLRPGLSPEQRRLLFDLALEKLALPLPAGENVPW